MATKKVIEVNETSIVDLRAELFRKEQQFRHENSSQKTKTDRTTSKKPPIWSKTKKVNSKVPASHDTLITQDIEPSEEEKSLQKSRQMLHAKAALYEKMAKGEIEDNEEDESGGRFLVDFHKKTFNEIPHPSYQDEEEVNNRSPTPPPSCPDEEWVDYVDSLGRSRRCLRKDLKELKDMEKEIMPTRSPSPPTLLSDDMRREIMRKRWEQEQEEAMEKPVGPVHYQNVQFDEVRNHGVGYYQFSKIEEEREKQMATLNKLREETQEQRSRAEKIKDKRKAALEARLAKVRARKKQKTGENVGDEEEDKQEKTSEVDKNEVKDTDSEPKEKTVGEQLEDVETKQIPEWARHRMSQPSALKSYVTQRRDERLEEFAPPSFYYDEQKENSKKSAKGGTNSNQFAPPSSYYESTGEVRDKNLANRGTESSQNIEAHDNSSDDNNIQHSQFPPYPPPASNLPVPCRPPPQVYPFPNLPPPPIDFTHTPPPGFPPLYPQAYPPFPPPNYNVPPPNVRSPWQQLPRQQGLSTNFGDKGTSLHVESNTKSTQDNTSCLNKKIREEQPARNDIEHDGQENTDSKTTDTAIADFISTIRHQN